MKRILGLLLFCSAAAALIVQAVPLNVNNSSVNNTQVRLSDPPPPFPPWQAAA